MGFLEDHIMICRIPQPVEEVEEVVEEPEVYDLTFVEAMKALAEGKKAMCENRLGIFYTQGEDIVCESSGDTFKRYWFNSDDLYSKWRVVG